MGIETHMGNLHEDKIDSMAIYSKKMPFYFKKVQHENSPPFICVVCTYVVEVYMYLQQY